MTTKKKAKPKDISRKEKTKPRNAPRKKKTKLGAILGKIGIAKALGQVALAMFQGAGEGVASRYIQNYEAPYVQMADNLDVDQPEGPLCSYKVTIQRSGGEKEVLEFNGYDAQLCNDIASKIIHGSIGGNEEEKPEVYPGEQASPFESVFPTLLHFEEPQLDPYTSDESTVVKLEISPSPEDTVYLVATPETVDPLVQSLYPNIDPATRKLWVKKVQGDLKYLDSITIRRLATITAP